MIAAVADFGHKEREKAIAAYCRLRSQQWLRCALHFRFGGFFFSQRRDEEEKALLSAAHSFSKQSAL
jgi:hypothetical protein